MNVLLVLSTKKYPTDIRAEREARALRRAGHAVFLMARRGPGQLARETVDGVQVLRVPLPFQGCKPLADFIYFFFQRYSLLWRLARACRRHRIDVLHVHDLPYAFTTAAAGRLLGLPVIFDMREHYVSMLASSFAAEVYRRFRPLAFILLGLLRLEELFACRWSTKVIVVADEHIGRVRRLGVRRANIAVVTNTEDIDCFEGFPDEPQLRRRWAGKFVIMYVGGLEPIRGLETVLRALPAIRRELPEAHLVLVGDGASRGELEQLTERLGLREHVTFTGFAPFAQLPSYIRAAAVCLVPHISSPHVDTTMPNKIFHYMMLGQPVVVSNLPPLMRVVRDAECGLIFRQQDPQSLAQAVLALRDQGLRRRLGENGRRAVHDRYHWQATVQVLLRLYDGLDPTAGRRAPRGRPATP